MRHGQRLVLAALCGTALLGCGSGGSSGSSGDPITKPKANVYGEGDKLADLLGEATWLDSNEPESRNCPDVPVDKQANVTGATLVWHDDFDETGTGSRGNFYMQDSLTDPVPYSGITVFRPGFSPPDLRVVAGDVIDLLGFLTEFTGPVTMTSQGFGNCETLPEMSGAMQFRFEGGGVPAKLIDIADLSTYATARQWFGMLVTIEQVVILADPFESTSGRYTVRLDDGTGQPPEQAPEISNELFDLKAFVEPDNPLVPSMTLKKLTGVVTYFYGIRVAPRAAQDIEL